MRPVLCGLAWLLLATPTLAYCGPILLFGDSRAHGVTGPGTSIAEVWNARHPERPMVNEGYPGRTTVGGLANGRSIFHAWRPSVILIFLDVNDQLIGLPAETTARNLYRLARLARTHQTEVYVLSNVAATPFTMEVAALERAWPAMRRVHLVTLWETAEAFHPFSVDGTHLNADGNAHVVEWLTSLLP